MLGIFNKRAKIKKIVYDENGVSQIVDTGNEVKGFLGNLDVGDEYVAVDKLGSDYIWRTKKDADIKDGDILEIDGVDYIVKACDVFEIGSLKLKKCIVYKDNS